MKLKMRKIIKMKNNHKNILIIAYSLFSMLILIANIGDGLLNKLLLELAYLVGNADPIKVSKLFDIFKLVFNFLIYTTFGILGFCLFLTCFDYLLTKSLFHFLMKKVIL